MIERGTWGNYKIQWSYKIKLKEPPSNPTNRQEIDLSCHNFFNQIREMLLTILAPLPFAMYSPIWCISSYNASTKLVIWKVYTGWPLVFQSILKPRWLLTSSLQHLTNPEQYKSTVTVHAYGIQILDILMVP
jgi:hypothetical protein